MFDLVPLARSRRIVADRDRHACLIAEFLETKLPGALPVSVPATAVGADEKALRLPVIPPTVPAPPASDAFHSEFRRLVRDSHVYHCPVPRDVISAIGDRFAFCLTRKVVGRHLLRVSLRQPPAAPVFKVSYEFLLLCIYGNHRITRAPKGFHLPV